MAPAGVPGCPDWLCDDAKAEWFRVVPILQGMAVVTLADLGVVAGYCQMWGKWAEVERVRAETPWPHGTPERRRIEATANECFKGMMAAGDKLGLSPSSRTGVKAEPKRDDTLDKYLRVS